MPPKPANQGELTQLLTQLELTKAGAKAQELMPMVYDELRVVARKFLRGERAGHTLQPTALVHEAYLKLIDQSRVDWRGRTHFFAVSASVMRRILIDHHRTRRRIKRGGELRRVALEDTVLGSGAGEIDFLELNDALDSLAQLDPNQACVVELRFFGGLAVEEVAELLGVSKRKIEAEWTHAKAWLKSRLATTPRP